MLPNKITAGMNLKNFLKVSEAATLLGVHPDTLRRWVKAKKITVYRHPINRYRLFMLQDMQNLLLAVKTE